MDENELGMSVGYESDAKSFSITSEESRKLEEEYEINDIIYHLNKALGKLGENTTLLDAIEKLKKRTRFADELERSINKIWR